MLRATVFSRCYVFGRALRRMFFRIVYFSLCFDNHFSFNFNVSLFFVYCLCFCSNAPSRFDELTDAMLCRPLGDKPLKPIASAVMWIVLPLRFVFFFFCLHQRLCFHHQCCYPSNPMDFHVVFCCCCFNALLRKSSWKTNLIKQCRRKYAQHFSFCLYCQREREKRQFFTGDDKYDKPFNRHFSRIPANVPNTFPNAISWKGIACRFDNNGCCMHMNVCLWFLLLRASCVFIYV